MSKKIDSTGNVVQSATAPHNDITTLTAGGSVAQGLESTLKSRGRPRKRGEMNAKQQPVPFFLFNN